MSTWRHGVGKKRSGIGMQKWAVSMKLVFKAMWVNTDKKEKLKAELWAAPKKGFVEEKEGPVKDTGKEWLASAGMPG